jgi:hypothetical protein
VLVKGLKHGTTYQYKVTKNQRMFLFSQPPACTGSCVVARSSNQPHAFPTQQRNARSTQIPDMTASMGSAVGRRRLLQDAAPPRGVDNSAGEDAATPRAEPDWGANPFVGTIKVPPATFPLKIGIWGDPGQVWGRLFRKATGWAVWNVETAKRQRVCESLQLGHPHPPPHHCQRPFSRSS